MKRFLLAFIFIILIVQPIFAADIVKITSEDILLIEPDFSDFVGQKMPFLLRKIHNLEAQKEPKHINAEFTNAKGFWSSVRRYYSMTSILKNNIVEFGVEAGQVRDKILQFENLFSQTSVRTILEFKLLQKNVKYSKSSILVLDKDFSILFEVLKNKPVLKLRKPSNIRKIIIAGGFKPKTIKEYTQVLFYGLNDLKNKKLDYGDYEGLIEADIEGLSESKQEQAEQLAAMFVDVSSQVAGKVQFFKAIGNFFGEIGDSMSGFYNFELYVIDNKKVTIASLITMIFLIIILLIVNYVLKRIILSRFFLDKSKEFAINTLKKYVIYFSIFIIILNGIGLDLSKITILVSALSVGIGFGLTTVVSNFISGILLLVEGTIKVGDKLILENGSMVTVVNIGLRKSVLKMQNNVDILTPNNELVTKNVINLTYKNNNTNRHKIAFSASNHADIRRLEKVGIESVTKSLGGKDKIIGKPPELLITAIDADYYSCIITYELDYVNNYVPDPVMLKNLLYDFLDNNINFFEDPPLNEVLAPVAESLLANTLKMPKA